MNAFERCLIWFGGYSPSTVAGASQEDLEQVSKLGCAVLFAAVVAFINWGIAGWTYSEGVDSDIRPVIVIAAAFFGLFMAALFDRSFLFFADTAMDGRGFKLIAFAVARVAIIIAIGSITSQTTIPLVLQNELKAHALQMAEAAEKTRVSDLNGRYKIEDQEETVNSAAVQIEKLQMAVKTLPPDIQQQINAANECWADVSAQKKELMNEGLSATEATERLAQRAMACNSRIRSANAERNAYYARIHAQLNQAITWKQARDKDLTEAKTAIKSKVERAAQVESESFNPRSSAVLWSLVSSNPGALGKWILISVVQLLCELVPLILKFQAGQSNIGRWFATNRALRKMDLDERRKEREHSFAVSSAVNETSKRAVSEALGNSEVLSFFNQSFAAYMSACAPNEAVIAMMRELEARHVDMEDFIHRFPRYAGVISHAWSKAIKDTADILTRGVCVDPR